MVLQKQKKNFQFEQLDSIQGHDSFLVDEDRFSKVIRDFFETNVRLYQHN